MKLAVFFSKYIFQDISGYLNATDVLNYSFSHVRTSKSFSRSGIGISGRNVIRRFLGVSFPILYKEFENIKQRKEYV